MPGYILHLTEASLILDTLQKQHISCTEQWSNAFLLGSLLPDTKRKKEKITSHFWNPKDLILQAIAPDLTLFLQQYGSTLHDPLMLGYLAHLHLDERFVHSYWPSMWEFLDDSFRTEKYQEHIRYAKLRKNDKLIPIRDFFSSSFYYGDYSRMNAYLLKKYQLTLPVFDPDLTCPVPEVRIQDLKEVLSELQYLCSTIQPGAEADLTVFDLPSLEEFVSRTASEFIQLYEKTR